MSFSNPFSLKTPGASTIGASEVNAAGAAISKALDGAGGGKYEPSPKLEIGGDGLEFADGGWPLLNTRTITRIEQTKLIPGLAWNDVKWGAEDAYIPYGECVQDLVPSLFFGGIVGSDLTTWIEFFPIHGASLTSLVVNGARNNVGAPGTVDAVPTLRAKSMAVASGTMSDLGILTNAAFTTSYANTSVWLTSSVAINRQTHRYFIAATHPRISTNFCGYLVRGVSATYSVSRLQY